MDENWRNTFGILMQPLGAGPGVCDPPRAQSTLYKVMLHIKLKVMESRIVVQ